MKMKTVAVAPLALLLAGSASLTAHAASRIEIDTFEAKVHRSHGQTLKYRELRPERVEPGRKYPLVLFMHGAGGRGDDNRKQLQDAGFCPKLINTADLRGEHACFIIAPQVPKNKRWVEVHWGLPSHRMPTLPGAQMRMALELVDRAVAEYPIDTSRIYVTGLSMGGFGTWDAIQRRPKLFAAAVPVCGGGDTRQAPKLKDIPLWVWHGDKDNVVKTKRSRDMVAAVKEVGGDVQYTELKGVGHGSWTAAYSSVEMWEWMFAQRKGGGGVTIPAGERVRVSCVGDSITFGAGIRDRKNNSYPVQLGRLLGDGWEVRNFGVSARTMLRKGDHPIWRERAYRDAKAFKPHVVVIKLGTNDTKPHNWKHKGEFAKDTADMVAEFRALETKPLVFLCRPVPAFPERWGISDTRIRNEVVPLVDLVAKKTPAEAIDLYTPFVGRKRLFPDRIHPNAEGAGAMAAIIAKVLKRKIKR
ncbi:MAG: GDSL-type esterase/lipase family protein [Planctomycetota bacterium]|jgi:lysophospholipase L1-like esterase/predicted esterase